MVLRAAIAGLPGDWLVAAEQKLFARLLGVHMGAESWDHFVAAHGLDLAWLAAAPEKILPAEMA